MTPPTDLEIRPRSTGEILDDAWRLYLAHAPLLLALLTVFTMPAALALLWLLTRPRPEGWWQQLLPAAVAALLLPLTGLGSAACQAALRRRAEGKPVALGGCLRAAFRHGWDHAAARALVLALLTLGLPCLLMPGLAAWVGSAPIHPFLTAGEVRFREAVWTARRETQRQPAKSAAVVLSRLPLLLLAVLNLHLFVQVVLWIGDNMAGLDLALAGLLLARTNPAYVASLALLAWLLLAPHAEAANYLLHVDARARYEGLDLWYRVQRSFPGGERGRMGAALLALGAVLGSVGPASGQGAGGEQVREVRRGVQEITQEVKAAEPYPGGARWAARLTDLADQLEGEAPAGAKRYRWFRQALDGFARRSKEGALQVLDGLEARLALVEEGLARRPEQAALTKEQIKGLVPPAGEGEADEPGVNEQAGKQAEKKARERVPREEELPAGAGPRGPGVLPPLPAAGFGALGWLLVAGLFIAIFATAIVLFLRRPRKLRPRANAVAAEETGPSLESVLTRPDVQTTEGLWRQAEEQARAGQFRPAIRLLYLAVLALLHRANLIRFERTRTNGEYVRQLRPREDLHGPFGSLTSRFESTWYSEAACQTADFAACRQLAEEVRRQAQHSPE